MLSNFFGQYKWIMVGVVFLLVSVGVWNVSGGYHENEFNAERVRLLNETIKVAQANEKLKSEITKALLEDLRITRDEIKKSNEQALKEIRENPIYTTCRITDGVRDAYKSAIKAQSASRGTDGAVPSTKGTPVR